MVLWKQELLANGTIPSGTQFNELVQNVRRKLYDLHKAEKQQRRAEGGREEEKNGEEDDEVSEVMEVDWYPKYWVCFLYLGPPFSVQHQVEVCSVLTRYKCFIVLSNVCTLLLVATPCITNGRRPSSRS
jgi:hypothetical protein